MYAVESPKLEPYTPDAFAAALKQFLDTKQPKLVLMPHTYQVRDFVPKLATAMGRTVISDCIGFKHEGGKLVFTRQMFQGKLAADVSFTSDAPWFATFQNGAFRGDKAEAGASAAPVETVNVEIADGVDPQQAAGSVQRGQAGGRSHAGGDHRGRGSRHQRAEEHRDREATGRCAGRRSGGIASDLRFGMAADGSPDWIVRTDGRTQAVSRAGHQRRDSAHRRDEGLARRSSR